MHSGTTNKGSVHTTLGSGQVWLQQWWLPKRDRVYASRLVAPAECLWKPARENRVPDPPTGDARGDCNPRGFCKWRFWSLEACYDRWCI